VSRRAKPPRCDRAPALAPLDAWSATGPNAMSRLQLRYPCFGRWGSIPQHDAPSALFRALPAVSPNGLILLAPQSDGSVRRVLRLRKPSDSRCRGIRTTRFQASHFHAVAGAATLFFTLVSSRYECFSIIVSSNRRSRPGWRFSDCVAVASWSTSSCTTSRLLVLGGHSHRLKSKGKEVRQADAGGTDCSELGRR